MASQVFDEPEQGRTEGLRLRISRTSPSMRRRLRRAATTRAATKRVGALTRRTGGLPDAGEKIRIRRSDRRPGGIKKRARLPRRSWGLDWRGFKA